MPMAQFEARMSAEPGRVVVALAGECDISSRDELASVLQAAVNRAKVVFIDMAALTFIDSIGVHGLVNAHHAATRAGGRLYVINASGAVATVLDVTGVGALLSPPLDGAGPNA
jgi:anti-sigma B factor antagonist